MKFILYIYLLVTFSLIATSQESGLQKSGKNSNFKIIPIAEVPEKLQSNVTDFFKTLLKTKIADAYETLLKDSPLYEKRDDVINLISQTKRSSEYYGKLYNFEPVNAEFVTESFIRLRYLAIHTKYPVRWIFTYYKSPEFGWIITNIKFDDLSEYFFSDQ